MPERIASLLAQRLAAIGFECDPLLVELVYGRIYRRGKLEITRLPAQFAHAEALWPSITYLLGMGASVTEFLTAGVTSDSSVTDELAHLGGIANALYGLFDWLLDTGRETPKLFGEVMHSHDDSDECPGTHQQLAVSLLRLYIDRLQSISSTKPEIGELTLRALQRLYAAELQSAALSPITHSTWWRKSALPILVMGLPAWISPSPRCRISFPEHLRWLAQTGEFTGWVDDFADYELDCSTGHANKLKPLEPDSILEIVPKVAEKGRRTLCSWNLYNENVAARNTFTVMIWSWLTVDPKSKRHELPAGSGS